MGVKLVSASGGSVELVAPATATNYTQTLPANSGTVLTNKTAGTVLQVVNATYGTQATTTSSTYSDTGLSASITPTSATSKILVSVCQAGVAKYGGDMTTRIKLQRNGSDILSLEAGAAYTQSGAYNAVGSCSCTYLDSPGTTSAVTYKTLFSAYSPGAYAVVQQSLAGVLSESTITLMEIAA